MPAVSIVVDCLGVTLQDTDYKIRVKLKKNYNKDYRQIQNTQPCPGLTHFDTLMEPLPYGLSFQGGCVVDFADWDHLAFGLCC